MLPCTYVLCAIRMYIRTIYRQFVSVNESLTGKSKTISYLDWLTLKHDYCTLQNKIHLYLKQSKDTLTSTNTRLREFFDDALEVRTIL